MVDYPKDSAQHLSQVEVAQGYIESGAKKHGHKYQVLPKLDEKTAAPTKKSSERPFKIKDYGATSFTDAVASHFYGSAEGYKGLTHEQRNVVLNIYLALASQGLDLNVCRPSDEWKFNLAAGTYDATLDGKKVSGKLEYIKGKAERERVITDTRGQLVGLRSRITAEAQNVLARSDSAVERTTDAQRAIEVGSLSNLMATLNNVDASGFEARKALLKKELEAGATKDQLVDDTITGINHYLELAGHADQKIDPETGKGYRGTAEQNKAWVKFIEDVLKPGLPEYLKHEEEAPSLSREELIAQKELTRILRHDFVTFLRRDYDFQEVQVNVFPNQENGAIDYIVAVTDENGEKTSFDGRLEKDFQGNVEDAYRVFVGSHADFFGGHVKTPEELVPAPPAESSPADRHRATRGARQAERRAPKVVPIGTSEEIWGGTTEAAEKPKTKLEQKTEFHRALDAFREEAIRNYANEVQLSAGRYGAENGLDPVTVELQAVPRDFKGEADYALVIKSGRFREDVPVSVKNPTAIMEELAAGDAEYYKKDPREVVEFDLTDANAIVGQALERIKTKKDRQIARNVSRERRDTDRGRARDARQAAPEAAPEAEVSEAAPEAAPQTQDKTAERLTAVGANPEYYKDFFTLLSIPFYYKKAYDDAVVYEARDLGSALELKVNRGGDIPYVVHYKSVPKEMEGPVKKVPCEDLGTLIRVLKQARREQALHERMS